ncbi:RNA polymerase subunit sigma-70 [Streptomyces cylindrosporus]|uniref:RNA polymerase sigma factor n=1 Tax=Streptomyces cylindrosporus TaxID=2927583 RepID=A0ABS9Y8W8_9ACTN|nr:RNA polymerase subunit sigma-70 [Streptomyces cylindrosporus]MCI3273668.1 RNA polymerase subunit sigma-70 [Streptomyces cylindrosporus]
METSLLTRARAGDGEAFGLLVEPYRQELHAHCYRILGSAQDAEDVLQETLLSAWRGLTAFEERSGLRTWLYRIATNRALDARRSAGRRPQMQRPEVGVNPELPAPTHTSEVAWLEPIPDHVLETLADHRPGPAARYEANEAISLAFVNALQLLPARQRAVLVLRDVLGYSAAESADILETSTESVTSALKRARATLARHRPERAPAPPPDSPAERALVDRLTRAYATADVDQVIALLAEDVRLSMPPVPFEYRGRDAAAGMLAAVFARVGGRRLVATRANHQPAFGVYQRERHSGVLHAAGLMVLTLSGDRIAEMTIFDNNVLARFGLPRTLPA